MNVDTRIRDNRLISGATIINMASIIFRSEHCVIQGILKLLCSDWIPRQLCDEHKACVAFIDFVCHIDTFFTVLLDHSSVNLDRFQFP